jgi:malonyl CoA-acyl carrier protein transacylase
MSLALLFPGQGAQRPSMLAALPDSPAVRAVLDESRSCLDDLGVDSVLDDAGALRDTTNVQLALLIAGVASARALCDDRRLSPRFVAGHSVGAFAAAVSVGVLTLVEALIAVRLRGELMKDACAGRDRPTTAGSSGGAATPHSDRALPDQHPGTVGHQH